MSISLEKGRTKQILGALLIWLLSVFGLALLADFLIVRLKLGSRWIPIAAAGALCLASAAASAFLFHTAKGRRMMSALLLGLVIASTLLMLGFLTGSEAMDLMGLLRVLACSLLGSLCGALIRRTDKKHSGRFLKKQNRKS